MLELYILGGFLLLVVVAIPLYFIGAALYQRKQDKENATKKKVYISTLVLTYCGVGTALMNTVSTITHLAKLSGLVKSYSEAKSLIKSGGLYLNNQKITDVNREISTDDLLYNKYILLRKGKSNYFIFKLNHDETSMANTTR